MTPALAVCMIVRNEAENLARLLPSLSAFADELAVVDTGSTDETREVARRFGARLAHRPWDDDFAAARNASLALATAPYALWLDADDRISPEDAEALVRLKAHLDGATAFRMVLENIRGGAVTSRCLQLRCFPRLPGVAFSGRVHEQVLPSLLASGVRCATTDIVIGHGGYESAALRTEKLARNLRLLDLEAKGGRDDGPLHYFRATTLEALGRTEEALDAMSRALSRLAAGAADRHLLPEGEIACARICLARGQRPEALRHVIRAGALGGGSARREAACGALLLRLSRPREAAEAFRRALCSRREPPGLYPSQGTPGRGGLFVSLAASLLASGDGAGAAEAVREAAAHGTALPWERTACEAHRAGFEDAALSALAIARGEGMPSGAGAPLGEGSGRAEKTSQGPREACRWKDHGGAIRGAERTQPRNDMDVGTSHFMEESSWDFASTPT